VRVRAQTWPVGRPFMTPDEAPLLEDETTVAGGNQPRSAPTPRSRAMTHRPGKDTDASDSDVS
jgi:hypothetical protein